MAVIIDADRTKQFLIKKSNETFQFLDGVDIQLADKDGILERKGEQNNRIEWNGLLEVQGSGLAGIHATGLNTRIVVGEDAGFVADIGILHNGDRARIVYNGDSMDTGTAGIRTTGSNARVTILGGQVASDGVGVDMRGHDGPSTLINGGVINAGLGVHIRGAADITNTGVIVGADMSIQIDSAKQASTLTNSGIIQCLTVDGIAVRMGTGNDEVDNSGIVTGRILLGAGDDRFVSQGIQDLVAGGKGDDLYIVNGAGLIREAAGGGFDVVRSSANMTLTVFIEKLVLTGNGEINGTGSSTANTIIGNSGKNILSGLEGNDTLTGKGEADIFVFADNFDKDVITDFKPNIDIIDITDWTAIVSFEDLVDNHLKIDGNNLIFKAGDDSLTLENVKRGQIDEADFMI